MTIIRLSVIILLILMMGCKTVPAKDIKYIDVRIVIGKKEPDSLLYPVIAHKSILYANSFFAPTNIQFIITSINIMDHIDPYDGINCFEQDAIEHPNQLNIYFVPGYMNEACKGWGCFPWYDINNYCIIYDAESDNPMDMCYSVMHEIGHSVGGLYHIFDANEHIADTSLDISEENFMDYTDSTSPSITKGQIDFMRENVLMYHNDWILNKRQ